MSIFWWQESRESLSGRAGLFVLYFVLKGEKMKNEIVIGLTLALVACGGGGGSANPVPEPSVSEAKGVYRGNTDTARSLVAVLQGNGNYYLFYGEKSGHDPVVGAVQGHATAVAGNLDSRNARDFNLEGDGIRDASVSATYVSGQYLTGSVDYGAGESMGFTTTYDDDYEKPADLAVAEGEYPGRFDTTDGSQYTIVTLTAEGGLSGVTEQAGGCDFSGDITPRNDGNLFRLSLSFDDPDCRYHGQTLHGTLYRHTDSGIIYAAALTADRTGSVFFYGRPPL
tara:strand:+ start:2283 stop:3128 length:846 start_codon:yes stop_codon:yes gene_type:complete